MAFHYCPQCGSKLQPGFKFCPSCGEKLPCPALLDLPESTHMEWSAEPEPEPVLKVSSQVQAQSMTDSARRMENSDLDYASGDPSSSFSSSSSSALIRSPIKPPLRSAMRKSCPRLSTPPKPAAIKDQSAVSSPRKRKAALETKEEEVHTAVTCQSPQTPPSGKVKRTKRASAVEPVQEGLVLCDQSGKKWTLGKLLSQTDVELMYEVQQAGVRSSSNEMKHIMRLGTKDGQLFNEQNFLQRAAKPAAVERWMKTHRLNFLGIPSSVGFGLHETYRFLIFPDMGCTLQSLLDTQTASLSEREVLKLALRLLDALEYLHENEYAHADLHAGNVYIRTEGDSQVSSLFIHLSRFLSALLVDQHTALEFHHHSARLSYFCSEGKVTESDPEPWIEQLVLNRGEGQRATTMPACCSCLMGPCSSPRCSAPPPGSTCRRFPLSCLMGAWHNDIIMDLLNDAIQKIAAPSAGHLGTATPTNWHRERLRCRGEECFSTLVSHLLIPEEQREMLTADPGVSSSSETPSGPLPPCVAEPTTWPLVAQDRGGDSSAPASDRLEEGHQLTLNNTRAAGLERLLQPDGRSRLTEESGIIGPPVQRPHPSQNSPAHQSDPTTLDLRQEPQRQSPLTSLTHTAAVRVEEQSLTDHMSHTPPSKKSRVHSDGSSFSYTYEPCPDVASALSRCEVPERLVQWAVAYLGTPRHTPVVRSGAERRKLAVLE
ncbi:hypothetical protein KOW79_008740 [Hemibagrus wyckioides]|uniref:Protein kinase domain-containing protein n=1 Tax=Hemibagrus wyckioides TaxID=337641 RepID=A0A9D3NRV6_9TELE|nr:hypothetical protein KOW79_008740 [Hemibagrus wyckioides]